jgi:hypothetical protein
VRQGFFDFLPAQHFPSAGRVTPPGQLGGTLEDFADSFENDMGYVDAFRLRGMSPFDDREHLRGGLVSDSRGRGE